MRPLRHATYAQGGSLGDLNIYDHAYAIGVYLLPVGAVCFAVLLMREYGYPCLLRRVAFSLLWEASRSEIAQARHHRDIRRRLEEVA